MAAAINPAHPGNVNRGGGSPAMPPPILQHTMCRLIPLQ
jgi:hypothetical protein